MFATPEDLRAEAWATMGRGVADRRHPARSPTLVTLGTDGPEARTVVLRGWRDGVAEMHTDAASAKVAELKADPRAALHVWVPRAALQIRLSGQVRMTVADAERWARVPEAARGVYGGMPTPGATMPRAEDFVPDPALARFCVLELIVARAEVLHLGRDLHRRAAFTLDDDGWSGQWIAP